MSKNLAVIGCGPALGFHVAKRFAAEGYNVGMISNMPDQLNGFVKELEQTGVKVYAFPADVADFEALKAVLVKMDETMGQIDVVEYSPLAPMFDLVDIFDMTPENTQPYIDQQLYGAMVVANHYMPQMRARKAGSYLVTTGATAHIPMASHANGAVSQSALCHYLNMLHERCDQDHVYVGSICIGAPKDDEWLANKYWEMCQAKDTSEYLYGNIKPTIAYQYYVNRGFGPAYPPTFTSEPPAPQTEADKDRLILALYDTFVCAPILDEVLNPGDGDKSIAFAKSIASKYGADFDAPYWGADGE